MGSDCWWWLMLPFCLVAAVGVFSQKDPCLDHVVLDDYRRSPNYQSQTPRDVLCDRYMHPGWYRFTIRNRSAEIPTHCPDINYCGTQSPLWLNLAEDESLPTEGGEISTTACSSWMDQKQINCCAMKYPVVVKNCSHFLVYNLQPTEACNMAYCASEVSDGNTKLTFNGLPEINAVRSDSNKHISLNCSVAISAQPLSQSNRFRFHWIRLTPDDHQTIIQSSAVTSQLFDLLARHKITAGDQVLCQVEALLNDPETGVILSNPSVTSSVFTAGISISPGTELVAYKNGSVINIHLSPTIPFVCAPHINPNDCHLSVELVQPDDQHSKIALSRCHLSLFNSDAQFVALPVTDFVQQIEGSTNITIALQLTSYGDAWWHGYQLPNITIQIKDASPIQCYAFTQGHIISVTNALDKINVAGRHLLYQLHDFQVWVDYQQCHTGRSGPLCICSVEVRSRSEIFRFERCQRWINHPLSGHRKRPLAQMSLRGSSKDNKMKVLESRYGKIITVVLERGSRVRIRSEQWGMSVSILDAGLEMEELGDSISGLCNPENSILLPEIVPLSMPAEITPLTEDFCSCAPNQDAYLLDANDMRYSKCDSDIDDCFSECKRLPAFEWSTLFNYLDVSDQVRLDREVIHSNLIDQPQRDSASMEDDRNIFHKHDDNNWSTFSASLGRDIHWTLARTRRAISDEDEINLYCSNFLVNSSVALECGNYLIGSSIIKAIKICTDDVSRNADLNWAQDSLGLLEDQCEIEATYRRSTDWAKDFLGRLVLPPVIVEALNCPNRCSHQGVCLPFGCVCQAGFSGIDCSVMDDIPPKLGKIDGDGLCDIRTNDCSRITITGSGFINSSRLSCTTHSGRFNGASWQRTLFRNGSQPIQCKAEFIDSESIICHLVSHRRSILLDDISSELNLEMRISNDGVQSTSAGHLTLYHSGCRSCHLKKDNWPLCVDREDVCYLDNQCFSEGTSNPLNVCESCNLTYPHSWSPNMKNLAPLVSTRIATSIYKGQMLEFHIPVEDDDQLTFKLEDTFTDAQVTKTGVFRWLAVSNSLLPSNHEIFSLSVSDRCHSPVPFQIHVQVLNCPCLNGGLCQNNSNETHTPGSYYCLCKTGFTGKNCSVQTNKCDPNPCHHGRCLNDLILGSYYCDCFQGDSGTHCNETIKNSTFLKTVQVMNSTQNDNECSIPCQNGGVCLRQNRCRCPVGFTGRQCQWIEPECPLPCKNGGHCSRRKVCACKKGWSGVQCETAICQLPCLNGGKCSHPGKCLCPKGFSGSICQLKMKKKNRNKVRPSKKNKKVKRL